MRISEIPHVKHGRIAVCGCRTSFKIDDSTVVEEYSLPDLPPPKFIGRYSIVRYVGRGAVNCVYEGVHPELGVRVAIKTLHPEYARDKPSRDRFAQAAKVYAKAVHPNIVKVYETGRSDDGVPFIAMEFLPGGSLADQLLRGKIFTPREAAEIGAEVCRALAVIAEFGIVHRDIKPDNIMISDDKHYKLTDLGLAKFDVQQQGAGNEACVLEENEHAKAKRKTGFGTLEYMSPEQHLDAESCDARSDIYSLGVTLYQLTAGKLPFEPQTRTELRHMHLTVEPLVPSTHVQGIPIDFDYIVMHCIQKRPEDRYQTPSELLADLEAFLAGAPIPSTTAGAVPLVHTPFCSSAPDPGLRRSWILPALAALLLLMVIAAFAMLLKERGKSEKEVHPGEREETVQDFFSEQSEPSGQSSKSAQDEPPTMDKLQPGGEMDVSGSDRPEMETYIIKLFETEKAGALQAIEKESGFKGAIGNLKDLKPSLTGKYAEEADSLLAELEKAMKDKVDRIMGPVIKEADPLVKEGKLNEAIVLYRTTMNFNRNASDPEFKDACREKIEEIAGKFMVPYDREARLLIREREFEKAVTLYVNVRAEIRDRSLAPELQDECNDRINELRSFMEVSSAVEQAMKHKTGFEGIIGKLNGFSSSPICADEARRLAGELENAGNDTPDTPAPATEEGRLQ